MAGGIIVTYLFLSVVQRLYKVYKETERDDKQKVMFNPFRNFKSQKTKITKRAEAEEVEEGEKGEDGDGVESLAVILDDVMEWHGAKVEGNFGVFFYHFFVLPFVLFCFAWFAYIEWYELYHEDPTVKVDWILDVDENNIPVLRMPAIEICPSHQTDGRKGSFLNQVGKAPEDITPSFNQWHGCRDYHLQLEFDPSHWQEKILRYPVLKNLFEKLGLVKCAKTKDGGGCDKWQQGQGRYGSIAHFSNYILSCTDLYVSNSKRFCHVQSVVSRCSDIYAHDASS